MNPTAHRIWKEAVDHCVAVSRETDKPGEWYEVYGPDDHVHYVYQTPSGKQFSCLGASPVACRLARDWWRQSGCPSLLNQPFAR